MKPWVASSLKTARQESAFRGKLLPKQRALQAAEAVIANPLIDDVSMRGARGLLISVSGSDLTLFEVDVAVTRIRAEANPDANIILGAAFDESLEGAIRVSVVATGVDENVSTKPFTSPKRANACRYQWRRPPSGRRAAGSSGFPPPCPKALLGSSGVSRSERSHSSLKPGQFPEIGQRTITTRR